MNRLVVSLLFVASVFFATTQKANSQGSVTDIDGNIYPTVIIGDQEWMAEDLRTTRYRNGDALLFDKDFKYWQTSTEGIWTYYDNNPAYNTLYGKLYNWYAVADARGLCPTGWRTPSDNDWYLLEEFIDPTHRGNKDNVGKKLKSRRQVNSPFGGEFNTNEHPRWDEHPVNFGTDEYGFNALPSGGYTNGNAYRHLGQEAYYWSASEAIQSHAWSRILKFSNLGMSRGQLLKSLGATVRCVKGVEQSYEVPQVNTNPATNITLNSASCGGEVLSDGGAPVSARGVVWSTSQNPKVDDNLGITTNGSGLGQFSSEITGLNPGITYWVRAYATNSAGTGYGIQVKLVSLIELGLPTVKTSQVTNITSTSAVCGGNVISDGGLPVIERGVVWSKTQDPTLLNNEGYTTNGEGTGFYNSSLNNLSQNTTYSIRAYATNGQGTTYGNSITFKTLISPNPDECIVAWYPFDGNANDESGNGYNGIVHGATLTSDRFGLPNSAYNFNGVDNFIEVPNFSLSFSELTLSSWFYFNPTDNYYNLNPQIIQCGISNTEHTMQLEVRNTDHSLYFNSLPVDYVRSSANIFSIGVWYHFVGVYNGNKNTIYLNGQKVAENVKTGSFDINNQIITIGKQIFPDRDYWHGYIDEIRVYKCALSESEILSLYKEENNPNLDGQPCPGTPTITDVDGNVYNTVQIGDQCWMKENLKVTRFQNGDMIDGNYLYNNLEINATNYGRLYNWTSIADSRNVCPNGWSLPDYQEWGTLISNVPNYAELKEEGLTHWQSPNSGATNSVGFTALPGGYYTGSGYIYLNQQACFWLSSETNSNLGWGFVFYYNNNPTTGDWVTWPKTRGLSVRCIKDNQPTTYMLTTNINPENSGITAGAGEYEPGTQVSLSATPNQGYKFVNWTINGEIISTENSFSYTMPAADVPITANFEEVETSFVCGTSNITFLYKGGEVTYGTVVGANGKCWLDRNLGAERVAQSSNDELSFGDLFQWGRDADGHQIRTSNTTATLSDSNYPDHADFVIGSGDWLSSQNDNLWQGINGVNNPCPSGFRIPIQDEWEEESTSWISNNSEGAFHSPLKLTLAGAREGGDGLIYLDSEYGMYWSSDVMDFRSRRIEFNNSYSMVGNPYFRSMGYSVRCIMDDMNSPTTP